MAALRAIAAVPASALIAALIGILWSDRFSSAYYSHNSVFDSVVGLAPLFLGRLLPVAVFVMTASWMLPSRKIRSVILFAAIGGLFGLPLDPANHLQTAPGFFYAEVAGSVSGGVVGLCFALCFLRVRMRKKTAEPGATDNPGDAQ